MDRINSDDEIYLREIQMQCRFALRAVAYADIALKEDDRDDVEIWYHIQTFIVACGNISIMLNQRSTNPKYKRYKQHHEKIVEKYDIPKYFFHEERNIRNDFEHYDERIVDWLEEDHNVRLINSLGDLNLIDSTSGFSYLKHLDDSTNTHNLRFNNHSIDIIDTYNQLVILDNHIEKIINPEWNLNRN